MEKANKEIREKLARYRIRQCEVADQLRITEFTLCRWLRTELKPDRKAKVEAAINEIVKKSIGRELVRTFSAIFFKNNILKRKEVKQCAD